MTRWLKPLVTLALYALVFYWTDATAIAGELGRVKLEPLVVGVLLYMAGQAISSWKWLILLRPVRLDVPYLKVLAFYFTGMFFNLFLPTIVGGDAVKAVLLARETGAPARATMSVFMERNVGLCALLLVAIGAAELAPPVELFGMSLRVLTWVLAAGYATVNAVLLSPLVYRIADRIIAATPLARVRHRADSLYQAIVPYQIGARPGPGRRRLVVHLPGHRDRRGILERPSLGARCPGGGGGGVCAAHLPGRDASSQRQWVGRARSALHSALRPHRRAGGVRGVTRAAVFCGDLAGEPPRRIGGT